MNPNEINNNNNLNFLNKIIKSEDFDYYYNDSYQVGSSGNTGTTNNGLKNQYYNSYITNNSNYNLSINKFEDTNEPNNNNSLQVNGTNVNGTNDNTKSKEQSIDEIFNIAKKAEELLRELINPNTNQATQNNNANDNSALLTPTSSTSSVDSFTNGVNNNSNTQLTITQQPTVLDLNNLYDSFNRQKNVGQNGVSYPITQPVPVNYSQQYYYQQQQQQQLLQQQQQHQLSAITNYQQQQSHFQYPISQYPQSQISPITKYAPVNVPLPHQVDPKFFATNPPPTIASLNTTVSPSMPIITNIQNQYRYPFNENGYIATGTTNVIYPQQQQLYYQTPYQQPNQNIQNFTYPQNMNGHQNFQQPQQQRYPLKRKYNDTRYRSYSNDHNSINFNSANQNLPSNSTTSTGAPGTPTVTSNSNIIQAANPSIVPTNDNEDDDINIMRERELKDLKCKSVVEKMNVFYKYYQQFKDLYQQRIQVIQCSDSLKMQFHSLIKYLLEYEQILLELNKMIKEHEHDYVCKNNHRKTKKFFNKTKAFIRYECYKRLQNNIFEYRRQINSQDRFAGMYDILEMNNYLIGLLPDIGVSIRRYINKCEKAKQLEDDELDQSTLGIDDFTGLNEDSESSNSSLINGNENTNNENNSENIDKSSSDNTNNNNNSTDDNTLPYTQPHKDSPRSYESFSKGIDSLNRYLLKRVENEETLDELVKERIIKWINKRQAKYILIFSEVDKLLNQHKDGECYSKFHSFLLFNLGKLVTVCDSYHQKLKELLYSTTIRRKKKRKKVKIVPESMSDVFIEINELKRALEHTKLIIKKCNEIKAFPVT